MLLLNPFFFFFPEMGLGELNRLIYRSKQRGFLELDLVRGKWVEYINSMDENGIKALAHVLNLVKLLSIRLCFLWLVYPYIMR